MYSVMSPAGGFERFCIPSTASTFGGMMVESPAQRAFRAQQERAQQQATAAVQAEQAREARLAAEQQAQIEQLSLDVIHLLAAQDWRDAVSLGWTETVKKWRRTSQIKHEKPGWFIGEWVRAVNHYGDTSNEYASAYLDEHGTICNQRGEPMTLNVFFDADGKRIEPRRAVVEGLNRLHKALMSEGALPKRFH